MILRLQVAFGADTAFPRDRLVITPHFEKSGLASTLSDTDGNALCLDLANALKTWDPATAREIEVKCYDAQGTPPVIPIGRAVVDTGIFPVSGSPREVAVCLSYYSGANQPRRRGRLYVPYCVASTGTPTGRPSAAVRDKVAELVPILTNLGGVDVDWVVYSRVDDDARPVSNWWIDDEWDIIQSRGMRGTTRTVGTASE